MQFITHCSCTEMSIPRAVRWAFRFNGPDRVAHLFTRQSLAREVVAAGVEAPLDEVGVHSQEVLHLVADETKAQSLALQKSGKASTSQMGGVPASSR